MRDLSRRDLLQVLRYELHFIEHGGYSRHLGARIFCDSLTCINLGEPYGVVACENCILRTLVPPEHRAVRRSCQFIPVGDSSIAALALKGPDVFKPAITDWLRQRIAELEQEENAEESAVPGNPAFAIE